MITAMLAWLRDVPRRYRQRHWPDSIVKASEDPFDYVLKLRDGSVICFSEAFARSGGWVHLACDLDYVQDENVRRFGLRFDRGVDVRLRDIVWCADCPQGS